MRLWSTRGYKSSKLSFSFCLICGNSHGPSFSGSKSIPYLQNSRRSESNIKFELEPDSRFFVFDIELLKLELLCLFGVDLNFKLRMNLIISTRPRLWSFSFRPSNLHAIFNFFSSLTSSCSHLPQIGLFFFNVDQIYSIKVWKLCMICLNFQLVRMRRSLASVTLRDPELFLWELFY